MFKDTVCTADPVQVKLGDVNGQFQFNVFSFDQNDNLLEIVCEFELCLSSENCFAPNNNECDQHYSKQEVSTTTIVEFGESFNIGLSTSGFSTNSGFRLCPDSALLPIDFGLHYRRPITSVESELLMLSFFMPLGSLDCLKHNFVNGQLTPFLTQKIFGLH